MVISGLIIEASQVLALTRDFLTLERRFFPGRFTHGPALDHVLTEIKGSEILQMTRSDSRNKRRQADLFRAGLLDLVEGYGCQLVGRVWVKESSVICDRFSSVIAKVAVTGPMMWGRILCSPRNGAPAATPTQHPGVR